MDTPRSMDISSARAPLGRALRAVMALEGSTRLAMICVIFGWFFMNTLVVSLGSLEHGVRFFDLGAVIADPMRLFFGVDNSLQRIGFGLVCLLCVAAPLAPHMTARRSAWFAYLAPLVLMVVCGAVLSARTSGEFFATPADAKSVSGNFIRFANDLVRQGSGLVSRHVSIGAGGYLALIGSAVLAAQGLRYFRQRE
jgi:hypothetical protein